MGVKRCSRAAAAAAQALAPQPLRWTAQRCKFELSCSGSVPRAPRAGAGWPRAGGWVSGPQQGARNPCKPSSAPATHYIACCRRRRVQKGCRAVWGRALAGQEGVKLGRSRRNGPGEAGGWTGWKAGACMSKRRARRDAVAAGGWELVGGGTSFLCCMLLAFSQLSVCSWHVTGCPAARNFAVIVEQAAPGLQGAVCTWRWVGRRGATPEE